MEFLSTMDLLVDERDRVMSITLNRPERRNPLSLNVIKQLDEVLTGLMEAKTRVVVLASTGNVFSAGHDLTEIPGQSAEFYKTLFTQCSQMMTKLRSIPQPVIAKVDGLATAAGCQLVSACDLVVASEQSKFATPGVKIGLFCTTPMVPLVRSIPAKVAMEMLLTGQPISAHRAYEIGLVNRVVPSANLDAAVDEFVQAICATSSSTIALGKRAFYRQQNLAEPAAYDDANKVMTENIQQHDAQEGIAAFLGKRKPNWQS